ASSCQKNYLRTLAPYRRDYSESPDSMGGQSAPGSCISCVPADNFAMTGCVHRHRIRRGRRRSMEGIVRRFFAAGAVCATVAALSTAVAPAAYADAGDGDITIRVVND